MKVGARELRCVSQACISRVTNPRGPAQATHIPSLRPQTESYVRQLEFARNTALSLAKLGKRDPTLRAHAAIRPSPRGCKNESWRGVGLVKGHTSRSRCDPAWPL